MSDDAPRDVKVDAYMPLWIGDYLADTMRLAYPEHGAYLLLIMAHWRTGPLPEGELSTIVGCDPRTWRNKLAGKLARFFRIENGYWHHDRVIKEQAKALANKEKFAERAKRAAEKRWSSSDAPSMPQAMLEQCPSPSPSPVEANASTTSYPPAAGVDAADADADAPPPSTFELNGSMPAPPGPPACPVERVIALYHEVLPELPRIERVTEARRAAIRQRWREWAADKRWRTQAEGLEEWRRFFDYVRGSAFLMGKSKPREPGKAPFIANLEWLMRPANHVKVFEGQYHD